MQHRFGKQKEEKIQGYSSTANTGYLQNKKVDRADNQGGRF